MRQRNLKTKTGRTKTGAKRPGECMDGILAPDDTSSNDNSSDDVMTRVTLARVTGSHCGQNTYVSVDGREAGSLHRSNPDPDGPEKRWNAQYTAAGKPRSLGVFLTERSGVRRIADHHLSQVARTPFSQGQEAAYV